MKVELEIVADRNGCTITINGKTFTSERDKSGLYKDVEKLWATILKEKVFDDADDAKGIYNEDSEYPCSILDVVITDRNLDLDGYHSAMDDR